VGDEPGQILGPIDFMQLVAHETGHALCLAHVCSKAGEAVETSLLGHACQSGDETFLMYPYWNVSDSLVIPVAQVTQARAGATFVEDGKAKLASAFQGVFCGSPDIEN
jgi:hypothetical protein